MTAVRDDPLRLAADLRPQSFGLGSVGRVSQPVVEPLWAGLRVIVAVRGDDVLILDDGRPVEGHGAIRRAVATATSRTAEAAIYDGYLTKQVVSDEPAPTTTYADEVPSTGRLIVQSMVGVRRDRAEEATKRLEADQAARTFGDDDPVNLVATDLLWLDGEWLLEVPLLERKRLLESVLPGDRLVRAGPYVLPPVQTWIGSWRAQGFSGVSFKSANARYRPGERTDDWAVTDMPRR